MVARHVARASRHCEVASRSRPIRDPGTTFEPAVTAGPGHWRVHAATRAAVQYLVRSK